MVRSASYIPRSLISDNNIRCQREGMGTAGVHRVVQRPGTVESSRVFDTVHRDGVHGDSVARAVGDYETDIRTPVSEGQ